jgi:epoxyqueuosine reductase
MSGAFLVSRAWAGIPGEELREGIGKWIYGCDACQDACPLNKDRCEVKRIFPDLRAGEEARS